MSQQRSQPDRRQTHAHPLFNIHSLRGRRRRYRRVSDEVNPVLHLDWHQPHLLFITLATLVLCFADAHNTLQLLLNGATEVNALMNFLIHKSAVLFLEVKLGITAVCLIILVGYQHRMLFNRIRIRHVLYSIFGLYLGLISYELTIWPGANPTSFLVPMTDSGYIATALPAKL